MAPLVLVIHARYVCQDGNIQSITTQIIWRLYI